MRVALIIFVVFLGTSSPAQDLLNGTEPGSRPILDLNCTVTPQKPQLGLDLKFHGGYGVSVPLHELQGDGNSLSILFRVMPKVDNAEPVYFIQQVRVPAIDDKSAGNVTIEGNFDVGLGSYHVDWLMRDFGGRFCSSYWDFEASLQTKDRRMTVALPPNTIRRTEDEQFQNEPPVQRTQDDGPLDVKVLLNFAPQRPNSPTVDPIDTVALVSILRSISRTPRIGRFSLVVFNIQEQKELYRQDFADHIDFPALGAGLKKLSLGTVDLNRLAHKNGDTEFLSALIKNETTAANSRPDALIFVGPKTLLDSSVPQEDLKGVGDLEYPVFYMNFNPDPIGVPWRDAIGRMVKFFKGREYTITGPRDLWNAVTEMVSRISKSKQGRVTAMTSSGPQ